MSEMATIPVHRCRFVDYMPSAITSIAFPPLVLPSTRSSRKSTTLKPHAKFGTLAVGHANGDIELWEWSGNEHELQSSQAWVIEKTLPGLFPSKVDSVAFAILDPDALNEWDTPTASDLRLFSSGGGSTLLEWDIGPSRVKRTVDSQGGTIWCMSVNPASTFLALGCEDGTVRLLSIFNDTLTHHRRLDRVKCRILSIAWGPPNHAREDKSSTGSTGSDGDEDMGEEDAWKDSWLVAGCSDSNVRKWDVSSGRVLDRMGTDKIRGERTLVWAIGVFGDGTIVSGDSLGMIKFWDSRTCTQLQSFHAHGADVLCLAIGPEGQTVFTSGIDQKITQFSRVRMASAEPLSSRLSTHWVQLCSRRMHSHDVRSLATWPPYVPLPSSYTQPGPSDITPILASGGLDMSVIVTPAALSSMTIIKLVNPLMTSVDCTFEGSYHRRLAYSVGTSSSAIRVAPRARLITCTKDSTLTIWRIPKRPGADDSILLETNPATSPVAWEKVLEMSFNVHTNLIATAISDDGQWLVTSDMHETRLFKLTPDIQGRLFPCKLKEFSAILQSRSNSTGGLAFQFSPDSSRLVMCTLTPSDVLVIDLTPEMPCVLRCFEHHHSKGALSNDRMLTGRLTNMTTTENRNAKAKTRFYGRPTSNSGSKTTMVSVSCIAISPDGQWLATSDDHAQTHVFNLDSIHHHCVLPSFAKPVKVLTFDANRPNILLLAFPDNDLQFYDVESRQFPGWGKDIRNHLPQRFRHAHDPVLGIEFNPAKNFPNEDGSLVHALFWGATWICKLTSSGAGIKKPSHKRRRQSTKYSNSASRVKMVTHYRPILSVNFLTEGELVVIERPLMDVLSDLPPAYFKHKYGTS